MSDHDETWNEPPNSDEPGADSRHSAPGDSHLDQEGPLEYQPTILSRWLPIPKMFQSVETDGPFVKCIQCDRNLIESGEQYVVEKIFRRLGNEEHSIEPILELAICLDCRDSEGESMSAESATAIRTYFEQNVDFGRRLVDLSLADQQSDNVDAWVGNCLFHGTPQDDIREFQVVALCRGNELLRDFFPIMISGQAIEEISELLSEQTRGWMDDFIGDNFGMPSEFCQPPSFTPVFI